MILDTDTMKLGVIGDPIGHSLSPFLHGYMIAERHVNAVYLPYHVTGEETRRFHEAASYLGFTGYNATMPHKIHLMDIVDELDSSALMYGSVNTVRFQNGISKGYNTDAEGLMRALSGRGAVVKDADIMVIGAGGVSGALVRGFAEADAASVTVLNRTVEKAESILSIVPFRENTGTERKKESEKTPAGEHYHTILRAGALTLEVMRETAEKADIIVNCTPVGMSGVNSRFEDLSFLDGSSAFVCDLIYNPRRTDFLKHAESLGLPVMNGLDMLIYQGILAFRIFTGLDFDVDEEFRRLYPLCEAGLKDRDEPEE